MIAGHWKADENSPCFSLLPSCTGGAADHGPVFGRAVPATGSQSCSGYQQISPIITSKGGDRRGARSSLAFSEANIRPSCARKGRRFRRFILFPPGIDVALEAIASPI